MLNKSALDNIFSYCDSLIMSSKNATKSDLVEITANLIQAEQLIDSNRKFINWNELPESEKQDLESKLDNLRKAIQSLVENKVNTFELRNYQETTARQLPLSFNPKHYDGFLIFRDNQISEEEFNNVIKDINDNLAVSMISEPNEPQSGQMEVLILEAKSRFKIERNMNTNDLEYSLSFPNTNNAVSIKYLRSVQTKFNTLDSAILVNNVTTYDTFAAKFFAEEIALRLKAKVIFAYNENDELTPNPVRYFQYKDMIDKYPN